MTINYDGTVSVCNDDLGYWHKLGDVNKQSVKEVWNSKEYKNFRMMHLDGKRSDNKACGTCQYINALPDNIDQYREVMKNAFLPGL
jgi:radical SAM protein with 4Fe4S-binding SPASM domain